MKKQEKIDVLKKSINEKKMITCYFSNDISYSHLYVTQVNDKFIVGAEEFDFFIKGYEVTKISRLKRVRMRDDKCDDINEYLGVPEKINIPNIDISSLKNVLLDIQRFNRIVEIRCDNSNSSFYFGKITKVKNHSVVFNDFDADGEWFDEPLEIPFSAIDSIIWNSTYTKGWELYFDKILNNK